MTARRSSPRALLTALVGGVVACGFTLWWWWPAALAWLVTPREAVLAALVAAALLAVRRQQGRQTRLREAAAHVARMEVNDAMLRMLTVLDSISDGVFVCNTQGRLTLVNPSGWRLLGIDDEGGMPRTFTDAAASVLMRRGDNMLLLPAEEPLALALGGEPVEDMEVIVHHGLYGDDRYLRFSARPLHNAEGSIVGAVAVAVDVTEVKETHLALSAQARTLRQLNAQLTRLATRDNLTGLYNRRGFEDAFAGALEQSRAQEGMISLLLIDVDHFKEINDTFGHPAGDAVLTAVAERIEASVRTGDSVARLGGDEFAVILAATDHASAAVIARRVHRAIQAPLALASGPRPLVTVSIGVAALPAVAGSLATLLTDADHAMYTAKRAGRGGADGADAPPLRAIAG